MGIGLFLSLVILKIGHHRFLGMGYVLYIISIALLIAVFFLGRARLGAQRWISVGWFNLQPSEMAKIAFILVMANFLGHNSERMKSAKSLIFPIVLTIIPVALILYEPDLGTAIVFLPVCAAMLYAAGVNLKHLLGIGLIGAAASPLLWSLLKGYQKQRLMVFINPDIDPLGAGYTIIQSKISIGSGGLFGKGWLSGTQNQLNFLPERHTDFIFSVVGEEWGFAGAILLLGMFLLLLKRVFLAAEKSENIYSRLMIVGIATLLTFQIVVNIGMSMGLLPVVGLTLPLISYGGSSLIVTLIALALVLDVGV